MFETLPDPATDALVAVSKRFREDTRSGKLDLGVGVYRDADGAASILSSVKLAEQAILQAETTKAYLPPNGDGAFSDLLALRVLGSEICDGLNGRLISVQCPGGTGALHQGLELVRKTQPKLTAWVGTPTWPNHLPMLVHQGLNAKTYQHYDLTNNTLTFDRLQEALHSAPPGDAFVLHGCCHNPTGADLNPAQWREVAATMAARGLLPIVDFAYQGFGQGDESDAFGVRELAQRVPSMVVAASCSKSFGLYRERTGLLLVTCRSNRDRDRVEGALQSLARVNYSNPPAHGAAIVTHILSNPKLAAKWRDELEEMRGRVVSVRQALVDEGRRQGYDFDFLEGLQGLFAMLALSAEQTRTLARSHAVHMPENGRVNLSGLSGETIGPFVTALKEVF